MHHDGGSVSVVCCRKLLTPLPALFIISWTTRKTWKMAVNDANRPNEPDQSSNYERRPLLERNEAVDGGEGGDAREILTFDENDSGNPRQWSYTRKMLNVAVIALMAILSPLASSMFTPGIDQIAEGLNTTRDSVIGCTTGFVIMLGLGPLIVVCILCRSNVVPR